MSEVQEDFLSVDNPIPGQNYVCLSIVCPEEIVADTIKDVERFRGSLAEDYFKICFYENAFDLCKKHDFKDAMRTLFYELGSFYFYTNDFYLEDLPDSKDDPMFWHGSYAEDFEAGYFAEFKEAFSKDKENKYFINCNKAWFSGNPFIAAKNQKMIETIEKHNSKIADR